MQQTRVRPTCNTFLIWISGSCERGISVDEAMIPFKSRSSLKQYLPLKPIKRGIKVWMRADAVSGYVLAFQVYSNKKGNDTEKALGSKVVKHLTEELQNTDQHVYFNNV